MAKRLAIYAVLAIALAAAGGCGNPTAPGPPTLAAPILTDTFTGTLPVGGINVHQFVVKEVGGIKVTLTDVVPSAAIRISIGTPSATTATCLDISGLTAVASANTQISGTATTPGTFCVGVRDVGNLVESVTYTISVLHS